jgi:hypothetical protein
VLAGAITLFVGWLGVSETAYTAKQLPYIAGCGLGGLALIGTGAMLWLSADLRDEWRKLDRIEKAIIEHGSAGLEAQGPVEGRAATRRSTDVTPSAETEGPRARVAAGRAS